MIVGLDQEQAGAAVGLGWPRDKLVALQAICEEDRLGVAAVHHRLVELVMVGPACSAPGDGAYFRAYLHRPLEDLRRALRERPTQCLPVVAYADGSGTTTDRPAGAGVVVAWPGLEPVMLHEHIPRGTNNVGELVAAIRALQMVPARRRVVVRTDSEYAISSALGMTDPKANVELVAELRSEVAWRPGATFEHVDGHSGCLGNELADALAGVARKHGARALS